MADTRELRSQLANELLTETRTICDAGDLDRNGLEKIRTRLQSLAAKDELWPEADYPPPDSDELQCRYLVATEGDGGITLYLKCRALRENRATAQSHDLGSYRSDRRRRTQHVLFAHG